MADRESNARWQSGAAAPLHPSSGYQLQAGKEVTHSFQAAIQIFFRNRIRHADVVLGTKGFAGNDHDMSFMQQPARNIGTAVHATLLQVVPDIGISVKGTIRR